jgi:hypothetical protein
MPVSSHEEFALRKGTLSRSPKIIADLIMIGTDKTQPLHIKQSIPVFVALYIGSRLLTGFTLGAVMVIVDLGSIFGFVLCAGSFFTLHLAAFQTRFF